MIKTRMLAVIGALLLAVIVCRLFQLQVLQRGYWEKVAAEEEVSISLVPARRGSLLAEDREVLAENTPIYYLTTTIANVYPEYAELALVLDQLQRDDRRSMLLASPETFPNTRTLDVLSNSLIEQSVTLLQAWHQNRERINVLAAENLLKGQKNKLQLFLEEHEAVKAYFKRTFHSDHGKERWDLWLTLPPGVTGSPTVLDQLAQPHLHPGYSAFMEVLSGIGEGEADVACTANPMDRALPVVYESTLFDDIGENAGSRLQRYVGLRRHYCPGTHFTVKKKGGLFSTRRSYTLSFAAYKETRFDLLDRLFSPQFFGNRKMQLEFHERCSADRILESIRNLLHRANRLFAQKFKAKKKTYSFFTAWEIAEAARSRYLENGLFYVDIQVISNLMVYKGAATRLLEILPRETGINIKIRPLRRYRSDEIASATASLVGIAKEWDTTLKWKTSGRPNYEDAQRFLEHLQKKSRELDGPALEALFRERRNDPDKPELRMCKELTGIQGLELSLDPFLRGTLGMRARFGDTHCYVAPLPGEDFTLTLDLGLTRVLYRELKRRIIASQRRKQTGFACVMDLQTGDLLSLVSFPGFDPHRYVTVPEYSRWLSDHYPGIVSPLRNHCLYPAIPGSVFKLFVSAAYLDKGGSAHRTLFGIDLTTAIKISNNYYFQKLGPAYIGIDHLVAELDRFGFLDGESGLENLVNGFTPLKGADLTRPLFTRDFLGRYNRLKDLCIGSGDTRVLPLTLLRFVGAVAGRGKVKRLRILKTTAQRTEQLLSAEAAAVLRKGMEKVVHEGRGTAHDPECGLAGYDAAAKTGTAELIEGKLNNAWITGFAPLRHPRFAFLIGLNRMPHGCHGGNTAGPVMAAALAHLHQKYPELGLKRE